MSIENIEFTVKIMTLSLGSLVEGIAAVTIALAIISSIYKYGQCAIHRKRPDNLMIRLNLGKKLALALEFMLAADILRTAVAPTWDEIGKLAAIAALRTLLNYFLERELQAHHKAIEKSPSYTS